MDNVTFTWKTAHTQVASNINLKHLMSSQFVLTVFDIIHHKQKLCHGGFKGRKIITQSTPISCT